MGYYSPGREQYLAVHDLDLFESQTVTASGTSGSIETDEGVARLTLDVTDTSGDGTETLDVTVETSEDDATWRTVDTFAQVANAAASERKCFPGLDRFVRISYTLGGGVTDYTFSVLGEAA